MDCKMFLHKLNIDTLIVCELYKTRMSLLKLKNWIKNSSCLNPKKPIHFFCIPVHHLHLSKYNQNKFNHANIIYKILIQGIFTTLIMFPVHHLHSSTTRKKTTFKTPSKYLPIGIFFKTINFKNLHDKQKGNTS